MGFGPDLIESYNCIGKYLINSFIKSRSDLVESNLKQFSKN